MHSVVKRVIRGLRGYPAAPEHQIVYVTGDIHGRADLLDDVFLRIDNDVAANSQARTLEVFLGDYVDRGPDSRGVIDRLIHRSTTHEVVALKGNHEAAFLDVLNKKLSISLWKQYGGGATLMSYGVTTSMDDSEAWHTLANCIPSDHWNFLSRLPTQFTYADYLFVHAGLRPGVPLSQQQDHDLMWIRDEFLQHKGDFGRIVVHGHTSVAEPQFHPNRINIDTGAYYSERLTCMKIGAKGPELLPY